MRLALICAEKNSTAFFARNEVLNILTVDALSAGKHLTSFFTYVPDTKELDGFHAIIATAKTDTCYSSLLSLRKKADIPLIFFHEFFSGRISDVKPGVLDYLVNGCSLDSVLIPLDNNLKTASGFLDSDSLFLEKLPPLHYQKFPGNTLYREPALKDSGNLEGPLTALTYYSRGCVHSCSFCAAPVFYRGRVDFRNPDCLISEFTFFEKQGISCFSFEDEDFLISPARVSLLCEKIRAARLQIQFRCHSRAERVSRNHLQLLKKMGCRRIDIGLESGSAKVLESSGKKLLPGEVETAVRLCQEEKILPYVLVIIGFPGETKKDLERTSRFLDNLKNLGVEYGISFFRNVPGSQSDPSGIILTESELSDFYFRYTGIRAARKTVSQDLPLFSQSTLEIEVTSFKKGDFYPVPLNFWEGDRFCRTGFSHLVGRFNGFIQYSFSAETIQTLDLTVSFRACTQTENAGQCTVSINSVFSYAALNSKSSFGEIVTAQLKGVSLQKVNTLEISTSDGNGISIFQRELDGDTFFMIKIDKS